MVLTKNGSELARVSIVDFDLNVIYDKFVKIFLLNLNFNKI